MLGLMGGVAGVGIVLLPRRGEQSVGESDGGRSDEWSDDRRYSAVRSATGIVFCSGWHCIGYISGNQRISDQCINCDQINVILSAKGKWAHEGLD